MWASPGHCLLEMEKGDMLTWATCSPLTVSGSPGSRAYQTRCSIPRMAQWRGITRDGTYLRCTDASRPCRRGKLKKARARGRGKVGGGRRVKRGGKGREKGFFGPRVHLFNHTPHLGSRLAFTETQFAQQDCTFSRPFGEALEPPVA